MTVRGPLTEVIALCKHLLFDFDGPICDIFAGLPAPAVAAQLRETVTGRGVEIPADVQITDDPFDVLKYAATVDRGLAEQVEAELRELETRGAESATATPGARHAIEAAHEAGYGIAAVGNISRHAIDQYLTASGLAPFFSVIVGRSDTGPSSIKPYSDLITQAVRELGAGPYRCALIGDSVSDIGDAQKAQVYSIGYATTPDEEDHFTYAGSDATITSLADLIPALAPVRDR